MGPVLVTFSLLEQNTQHPQGERGKVYVGSRFVEVSAPSQLAPGQGSVAEGVAGKKQFTAGQARSGKVSPFFPFLFHTGNKAIGWCHPHCE